MVTLPRGVTNNGIGANGRIGEIFRSKPQKDLETESLETWGMKGV